MSGGVRLWRPKEFARGRAAGDTPVCVWCRMVRPRRLMAAFGMNSGTTLGAGSDE